MPRIGANLAEVQDDELNTNRSWHVLPDGWYRAMLKESHYKPTGAGDGMCLHLHNVLLDHDGKELRDFLTLEHPKQKTVHIAKTRLKELAIAVGHPTPNNVEDSDELMGKPYMIRLYSSKASDPKYGDRNGMQNSVGEYKACEGAAPAAEKGNDPPPPSYDEIPF